MTQPPWPGDGSPPRQYETQRLSDVQAASSRRRRPTAAIVVLVGLVAALGVGIGAWLVLSQQGEETREEYCRLLADVTAGGDLESAFAESGMDDLATLQRLVEIAPGSVEDHWAALGELARTASGDEMDADLAIEVIGHVQAIASDAKSECGIEISLPTGL